MTPKARPAPHLRAARARSSDSESPAGIVSCRLRVTLPRGMWMQRFTTAHPALQLEVFDRLEVDRQLVLFELRIPSEGGKDWAAELRRLPHVWGVELMDGTAHSGTYRVLYAGRTFLPVVKKFRILRQFPFPIRNGVATWTLVGSETKIRKLLAGLGASGISLRLDVIRRGPLRPTARELTPRQREILRRALLDGYFEVPRRTSLTKLASRIGVATATLSIALAVIEKRIVESHAWSSGFLREMPHSLLVG